MLTDEQRQQMKELIQKQIRDTEEMLASLRDGLESLAPDAAVGRLGRMDAMVNQSTLEKSFASSQSRLTRLGNRLARIDDPKFDLCGRCTKPIAFERLLAAPDRGTCTQCLKETAG